MKLHTFYKGFFFAQITWLFCSSVVAGTWTPLDNPAPGSVQLMLLLPDGTVICANNDNFLTGNGWFRLTPDSHGSYLHGTWSSLAPMHDTRRYYSSAVLRDGRVLIAGGELGSGASTAEVYSPLENSWTMVSPPPELLDPTQPSPLFGTINQAFFDSCSVVVANGDVLISPVTPNTIGGTLIFHPSDNSWSAGPTTLNGIYQDEASWVKLPDGSILTIDPFENRSERYIPSLNQWVQDSIVPQFLYSNPLEMGPAILLPDGRALFIGGNGHSVFYTPTGTTAPGRWTIGPDIPGGLGVCDGPSAMMPNGKILLTAGNPDNFNPPTVFFEFDPASSTFTQVNGPPGSTDVGSFQNCMLDLPDGSILYSSCSGQLYTYTPTGTPLASGKPRIISIDPNPDGSYHLTGTLLNGISQGAFYGDDQQMDSNYPLVRLTDASGIVRYARTFNWSSTGVMTGNTPTSTEFVLPPNLPPGNYSFSVVANGISSDPVEFPPAQPLIANGGFENGNLSSWIPSANLIFNLANSDPLYTHSGQFGLRIGPETSQASLSQLLPTTPGSAYLLSLWLRYPTSSPNLDFNIQWNAATLLDQTSVPTTAWTNLRFVALASSSTTTLQLSFRNASGFFGLDDVTLTPVPTPAFQSASQSNQSLHLTWTTFPGLNYQIQFSSNLAPTNWVNLGNPITANTSTLTVSDPVTPGTNRFYRILLLP